MSGIPDGAVLSRIEDKRLLKFFDLINESPVWPDWERENPETDAFDVAFYQQGAVFTAFKNGKHYRYGEKK